MYYAIVIIINIIDLTFFCISFFYYFWFINYIKRNVPTKLVITSNILVFKIFNTLKKILC